MIDWFLHTITLYIYFIIFLYLSYRFSKYFILGDEKNLQIIMFISAIFLFINLIFIWLGFLYFLIDLKEYLITRNNRIDYSDLINLLQPHINRLKFEFIPSLIFVSYFILVYFKIKNIKKVM